MRVDIEVGSILVRMRPFTESESRIARLVEEGDVPTAVSEFVRAYGQEIFGYLVAELRDEQAAREVYSTFAFDLLRGLEGVRIRTSARAYAYQVARHAAGRHIRRASRERRMLRGLDSVTSADLRARPRTPTPPYRRTDVKDVYARLRDRLDDDERRLLVLRVDRGLAWREIAESLSDVGEPDLERDAARLRKRFELLKRKIRGLAIAEGILEPE